MPPNLETNFGNVLTATNGTNSVLQPADRGRPRGPREGRGWLGRFGSRILLRETDNSGRQEEDEGGGFRFHK